MREKNQQDGQQIERVPLEALVPYARKIRRTGPGFNGAAWMNTMERVRSYTSEPILPGFQAVNAPHEGPGAASSRTVPLDAVVRGGA